MMDHKADVQVGTLLPAMARGAREEGDLVTAELLCAEAMRHFDDGDRFVEDGKILTHASTTRLRGGLKRPPKRQNHQTQPK